MPLEAVDATVGLFEDHSLVQPDRERQDVEILHAAHFHRRRAHALGAVWWVTGSHDKVSTPTLVSLPHPHNLTDC